MATITFEWLYMLPVAGLFLHAMSMAYYEKNDHHHDGTLTRTGGNFGSGVDSQCNCKNTADTGYYYRFTRPMDYYRGPWS